ncbi:MAG: F0F1 ATP synthase subunit B [Balneolales bacterium]
MNPVFAQGLLDVDFGLFFWVLITFLLFLFLLSKFAWKPILLALGEREKAIKTSLEAAQKAKAEAEQISIENEKALKEAGAVAQKIRKKALDEAESLRADRMEKAKKEAEKLMDQARSTIEQEKKQALIELRAEISKLAIHAASRILDEELDEKRNKKIVDQYIKELN